MKANDTNSVLSIIQKIPPINKKVKNKALSFLLLIRTKERKEHSNLNLKVITITNNWSMKKKKNRLGD